MHVLTPRLCGLLMLTIGLLFTCSLLSLSRDTQQPTLPQQKSSCSPLPKTFTEADLVGTWEASYGVKDKDTLIIKADGTYKQIYENPGVVSIETNWQRWWLEKRDSGYARLHLDGMRRCDLFLSVCNRSEGGLDPIDYTAIDVCEGGEVEMSQEVILIVTGIDSGDAVDISLRQTRISGSDWSWYFSRAK